eukprot:686459-Ditylum_brightwellii.AAC.1
MEAVFFATTVADGGQVLWRDLIAQHNHVVKFVLAKDQVVGSALDHIDPVVHTLACPLYTPYLVGS